jgi:hypothetical protein
MAKKKEQPVKPEWDEKALKETLLKIEGVSEEIAEHAAKYGVVDDAYVVQTFYRVSDVTARAIIEAFKEAKNG